MSGGGGEKEGRRWLPVGKRRRGGGERVGWKGDKEVMVTRKR